MSDKPTDPSGGCALDVLPSKKLSTTDAADMAAVHRAQQVILDCLCEKSRKKEANTAVGWRGLWKQLGIEQKAYAAARQSFIAAGAVDVERIGENIQLGPGGRVRCGLP